MGFVIRIPPFHFSQRFRGNGNVVRFTVYAAIDFIGQFIRLGSGKFSASSSKLVFIIIFYH